MTSWNCEPYSTSHRGEVVRLWNRVFEDEPRFRPLTRALWRERVEQANAGEEFDPDLLWVAIREGRMVGFVHGGVWTGEFLRQLLPDNRSDSGGHDAVGYLAMVGVDPEARRQGVATSLVRALSGALRERHGEATPLLLDGRAFNPFYGNFYAPRPVLWGTPEGPAVRRSNEAADLFLRAQGFHPESGALTLRAELSECPSPGSAQALGRSLSVEVCVEPDYQPVLGSNRGNAYPFPNESATWLAIADEAQVGALIAYPCSDRTWAIFSLEVESAYRGRGVGRHLLHRCITALKERGVSSLEALVLPEESPGALHLYQSFRFQEVESWWVFG